MANFPNRCQHLKINGTQCESPALRRNRFCFFHKRFQDERIKLAADRRRRPPTFVLPVLEDANSIQIALMQVMRLTVSQQIDHKTASLLLYALQTASTNLRMTNFQPFSHNVVLDPRDVAETPLEAHQWEDEDFEDETEEEAEVAPKLSPAEALYARMRAERIEKARQRAESEEKLKIWAEGRPNVKLVRDSDGKLKVEYLPVSQPDPAPKKPSAPTTEKEFQADVHALARKHFFPNLPANVLPADQKEKKEGKK